MQFKPIDHGTVKFSFTTHRVPFEQMSGARPLEGTPQPGDLILGEVLSLGQHTKIEGRSGTLWHIFPGDLMMGVFGNRYATDQFEAVVPTEAVFECDLVSVGGVCGQVVSQHPSMDTPTRLRVVGRVCDGHGRALNLRAFGVEPREGKGGVVLILGSAMNAGKTTTVGTVARALKKAGFHVAAAKITGTAAGKDVRYFESCGARPALDFTHAGFPSTYMLNLKELLEIYRTLVGHLREAGPDFVVIEVADGIFQRETRMLLEHAEFRQSVDHVFFAASDSLSAECGVRCLKQYGLPLRAISGTFTQSLLATREAEAATGIRCLSVEQMMAGGVVEMMRLKPGQGPARSAAPARAVLPLESVNHEGNGAPLLTPAVLQARPAGL